MPHLDSLEEVAESPRSEVDLISERVYWNYRTTHPAFVGAADFTQRTSGFFKPPKSCQYSFSLYSDGKSALAVNLESIAVVNLTTLAQYLNGTDERF